MDDLRYFPRLGTGRTSQKTFVLAELDDNYCEEMTNEGLLHDMGFCLDAPERIPTGQTSRTDDRNIHVQWVRR